MVLTIPNITKCIDKTKEIFNYYNLDFPTIKEIKLVNSTSYYGEIQRKNNEYILRLSNVFNNIEEKESLIQLQNTITHEYIHTLKGCWNHGDKFKKWRNKILKDFAPIDIIRDTSSHKEAFNNLKTPKYIIKCEECEKEYLFYRKPKYSISDYTCSVCHSDNLKFKEVK